MEGQGLFWLHPQDGRQMAESGGRPLTLSRVFFCRSGLWLLLWKQPRLSMAVSVTQPNFRAQFRHTLQTTTPDQFPIGMAAPNTSCPHPTV